MDLTMLSSTVLFAEVNNMEENPENYFGKTIKMSGAYGTAYLEETDLTYHFVVVDDVTGCCQAAMEFIWQGDHAYPEDYPEETTQIEVIGVFKSYEELGYTWYYLDVNGITIL
ncbi:MAG: hypothetical protein FWG40_08385 [Peptococcaceae bacterium]|nr:hypothetical protein [Peptococcaceae bacterium]